MNLESAIHVYIIVQRWFTWYRLNALVISFIKHSYLEITDKTEYNKTQFIEVKCIRFARNIHRVQREQV